MSSRGDPSRRAAEEADLELQQGEQLRVSGTGRLGLGDGSGQLVLQGGTAILDGARLYVLRAGVDTHHGVTSLAGRLLSLGRPVKVGGAPSPELQAALDRFVAPAWRPALPRVTLAEVRRAERATSEQRRAERETASCGCTESRGSSGAPTPGTGPGLTPLERQGARLRVRILGVPRSE